ncbi:hypothetical protein [Persephonella sp.]
MYGRKKNNIKRKFVVPIVTIIILLFNLDNFLPIKIINISENKNISVPENPFYQYPVIYGINTYKTGKSLITDNDILKALKESNFHYAFLKNSDENIFEKKYDDYFIFNKKVEECVEIFNINHLDISIFDIFTILKFYLWYPVNKDLAFNNLWKLYSDGLFFKNYNLEKDKCFIGELGGYIKFKIADDFAFPDLSREFKMIRNNVVLEEELSDQFYTIKLDLYLAMESGRSIVNLYHNVNMEIFVKTDDGFFTIGDTMDLSTNPEIFVKVGKGKFITAVYKNGKLREHFPAGNIHIKPENTGYYYFIVYKYNFKLPFNIYLGVRPVAFSNGIFIQ